MDASDIFFVAGSPYAFKIKKRDNQAKRKSIDA